MYYCIALRMVLRHPRLLTTYQAKFSLPRFVLQVISVILSPIIVPLRLICILLVILVYSAIMQQYVGVDMDSKQYERYRSIMVQPFKIVLLLLGIQVKVKGEVKARIVVSNHYSTLDVLALVVSGVGSFIAKGTIGDVKILLPYLQSMKCLFARNGHHAADELLRRYGSGADGQNDGRVHYPSIAIFAAGTTTCYDCYCRFRSGAFLPMCSVYMCKLSYQTVFDLQAMLGSPLRHFLLLVCNLFGVIEVEYFDVVSSADCADAEAFRLKCYEEYGRATGLEFCDYAYSDLLWFSGTMNYPPGPEYMRDFGYMGRFSEWSKRCRDYGVNKWTQPEIAGTLIV